MPKEHEPGQRVRHGRKETAAAAPPATAAERGHAGQDAPQAEGDTQASERRALDTKAYDRELARLQIELSKLQEWVRLQGWKLAVIFEGRDAAGKGGVIQR
ncbi:MAG TPA: hypothetical protein VN800_07060, partial [Candidatus Acidoferrales bacterium]|nr:hypothetical protein [Candidatus Acidoferrales bacterium]